MFKNILFDLDGTIIDSREGIINGFVYTLKHFDIEVQDRTSLEKFIGPPLEDTFVNYYNLTKEQAKYAIEKYREFYEKTGVWETKLYKEIDELIRDLKQNGKNVLLATSKPEPYANKILEKYNLKQYFYFVSGATLDGTRNAKKDVIKFALDNINNFKLEECIMVGDRNYDILGAKANNLKSIGVTYGFGTKQELETAGADYIAEDVEELRKVLLK